MTCCLRSQNPVAVVDGKTRSMVFSSKNLFSTRFDPKHPGNILRIFLNQTMTFKNAKKSKT
jgi:hypothetical protein